MQNLPFSLNALAHIKIFFSYTSIFGLRNIFSMAGIAPQRKFETFWWKNAEYFAPTTMHECSTFTHTMYLGGICTYR